MSPRLAIISLTAALALVSVAVAGTPSDAEKAKDAQRLEAARANAGDPVKTVRFLRPIHSYEVVGDQSVLVWETKNKAWLVDLSESDDCRPSVLHSSFSIGLDSSYDTMNTSNGYVVGDHSLRCKITQIREVDVRAMRVAERGGSAEPKA